MAKEFAKGDLILESFQFGSILQKKKVPNHSPEHLLFRWIVKFENLSEIKPHLSVMAIFTKCYDGKFGYFQELKMLTFL